MNPYAVALLALGVLFGAVGLYYLVEWIARPKK